MFLMLNPSTATHLVLDRTLRRCRAYAEEWGYSGFVVANLFAFRATAPKDMATEVKFTMSVPALDALRRIMNRDFMRDMADNERALQLPQEDPKRIEIMRAALRNEHERGLIERTLGFDSSKDEKGA